MSKVFVPFSKGAYFKRKESASTGNKFFFCREDPVYFERKKFAAKGRKFFSLRVNPFLEWG